MSTELTQLSNAELLQRVWIERNPLTTTELETLLAERFHALLDEHEAYGEQIEAIDEHDADGEEVKDALQLAADFPDARPLLDVLKDFDVDDPALLRAQLDRLKKFDQAMEDLREPLQSLTTLATTE